MTSKEFQNILMSKTGISETEYNDLFNALDDKYGISIDSVVEQIPSKIGVIETDTVISMVAPNTSNADINPTKYDKQIAEELDVEPETVAKLTYYMEVLDNKLDNVMLGDTIRETLDNYGASQFLGSQRDVGKEIVNAMGIENEINNNTINTAESATQINLAETFHEFVERRRAQENAAIEITSDSKYVYGNICLKEYENGFDVYVSDKKVSRVPVADENKNEYISEFAEKIEANKIDGNGVFDKLTVREIATQCADEVEKEKEIGTGSKLKDIHNEILEDRKEELTDKLSKIDKLIESSDNKILSDVLANVKNDIESKLNGIQKTLDEYQELEMINAKEMQAKLEAVREEVSSKIQKLDTFIAENSGSPFANAASNMRSSLAGQLDEIDDKLTVIDNKIDAATTEQMPDISVEKKGIDNNLSRMGEEANKFEEYAKDATDERVNNLKNESRMTFVEIDNIIGEFKDSIVENTESIKGSEAHGKINDAVDKAYDAVDEGAKEVRAATNDYARELDDQAEKISSAAHELIDKESENVNDKIESLEKAHAEELEDEDVMMLNRFED